MIWVLGVVLLLGGGWISIQSTTTRFAPACMVAGGVILLGKMFS